MRALRWVEREAALRPGSRVDPEQLGDHHHGQRRREALQEIALATLDEASRELLRELADARLERGFTPNAAPEFVAPEPESFQAWAVSGFC
jgi:hypothetical protein